MVAELIGEFETRHVRPRAGRTLIVGSHLYRGRPDRRARYQHAIGVDQVDGPGVDRVLNLEETPPPDLGTFHHIECMSVLEHSPRPWLLAANIERLLTAGGTLFLTVPFVWSLHAYPHDYFRLSVDGVRAIFPGIEWKALQYAHKRLMDGGKTPRERIDGRIYVAATEVCGFGVRP